MSAIDNEKRVEKSNALFSLLTAIESSDEDTFREKEKEFADQLAYVYEDGTYRHQYSEITWFLYSKKYNTESYTSICDGLHELEGFLLGKERVIACVEKLIDHIMLESVRMGQMEQALKQTELVQEAASRLGEITQVFEKIEEKQKSISEQQIQNEAIQKDVAEQLAKDKEQVTELSDEVRKHNIDTITVLSIFAGVVFAFTGGFTLIGNVLQVLAHFRWNKLRSFWGVQFLFLFSSTMLFIC